MECVVDAEIGGRGEEHGVAHDTRLGGADHDAVHDEGHGAGDRDDDDPDDVLPGRRDERLGIGGRGADEQPHQITPPDDVDDDEQRRDEGSPRETAFQAAAQRPSVAGADEAACERFGGVGETVVHVGEQREEFEQQSVHGQQFLVAQPCRRAGEEGIDSHDAERAQDDVAVDREIGLQRPQIEHLRPVDQPENGAVFRHEQYRGERHARPLGDDRGVGDAHDAQIHAEGEPEAAKGVDDVHGDGRAHGEHGVLHSRVPAVEAEEQDARRHGPDTRIEVVAGHLAAVHGPERQLAHGVLERDHQQSHRARRGQRAGQHVGALAETARTERLRREAARAHPHERTVPVDEVEDRNPDGQRADGRRRVVAPVSRDGCRDDAHERHGDVRDDVRQRDAQYFAVHVHIRMQR